MNAGIELSDFYARPVVYDILHTPGTAAEVDLLDRIHARHGETLRRRPVWLEPACGTGRYLRVAAGRGARVIGFDRSAAMIEYARHRLQRLGLSRRSDLFVADMACFAHRAGQARVDLAFNLVNTLRHLPSDSALLAHLADVARCLRPGGLYAVGISLSRYDREEPSEDLWEGRRGRCHVRQRVQYLPPGPGKSQGRREQVISHLQIERPRGIERVDSTYWLRCYDETQWHRLLAGSALQHVVSLDDQGRLRGSRELAYQIELLRRR